MIESRFATHPEDFKRYTTGQLRKEFLVEAVFADERITYTYSHYDRLIIGGARPIKDELTLGNPPMLKSNFFLERRELGIINIGGAASVSVDGKEFQLQSREALYVGKGAKSVTFHPNTSGDAHFYFNSAPAHASYPTRQVTLDQAETVELGALETSNHRTIRKLLIHSVLPTCQLQMGLTELKPGSVWNTMPPHTHDRRMEAYFYFNLAEGQMVSHFMGEPDETRHLWVKNHQAIISPPWSIHCGAGTTNYSFIWGMAGENLDYSDMDQVPVSSLK